ncbi:TRAP transporter substrate-binding protein [Saccharospirillum salsuginis]|uniref:ABC transporter substrate-binding protein n=1 Tax=Saccharospirillum salsuginis TaxID=418750 RepID=A0A918KMS4_9GAMM|nr:TRAP transporter substrate-binding protein [Saccharospirillum salsuginis]GGX69086.1 ABC transporter substrate-binding protein [Saccharospirillum salsuginis]
MLELVKKTSLAGLVAATTAFSAQAADVTLRVGHLWPSVAGPHTDLMQVWADTIEEESNGRIEVEVYPSGALAAPPAQYDAVKNRIMDVTATVQGYTANRFPLTQIVELPGVVDSAKQGSCVLQTLLDEGHLDDEYADTRPVFLFTHGPGLFHVADTSITEPSDLEGLRIRRPTTVVANILTELGAQPVGMPAPESYTSMQRGVIDGVALPWEGALSFRLNELADSHTEIGGLYTLSFVVTMNDSVYNSLSDENKAVIDANTGIDWAMKAGEVFDALDVKGRQQAVDDGHEIIRIEGGTGNPAWTPYIDNAREAYLADLESRGLPAREVYERALELRSQCEI